MWRETPAVFTCATWVSDSSQKGLQSGLFKKKKKWCFSSQEAKSPGPELKEQLNVSNCLGMYHLAEWLLSATTQGKCILFAVLFKQPLGYSVLGNEVFAPSLREPNIKCS